MSKAGDILLALQSRLQTLREDQGYAHTLVSVNLTKATLALNKPDYDCPYIDILNNDERYKHGASGHYETLTSVLLFVVMPKEWDDVQIENLKTDIRKCLYGGAPDASGNTGSTLGGKVSRIELVGCKGDLNMVDSARVAVIELSLSDHRVTYRD